MKVKQCERKKSRKFDPRRFKLIVRIRCSGHIHRIGLTAGGALVPFDHSKQEIRNNSGITKLGGDPCFCYKVIYAYLNAEMPVAWKEEIKRSSGANDLIFRSVSSDHVMIKISERIRRKRDQKRRRAGYREDPRTESVTDIHDLGMKVYELLVERGCDVIYSDNSICTRFPGNLDESLRACALPVDHTVEPHLKYWHFMSYRDNSRTPKIDLITFVHRNCTSAYILRKDRLCAAPIDYLADCFERMVIERTMIAKAELIQDNASKQFKKKLSVFDNPFEAVATWPVASTRKDSPYSDRVELNVNIKELTIHATKLVMYELNKVVEKIGKIKKSSIERLKSDNRVPGRNPSGIRGW